MITNLTVGRATAATTDEGLRRVTDEQSWSPVRSHPYRAVVVFEPADAEQRLWWESLPEGQRDLLREHSYELVLPEALAAIVDTFPGQVGGGDAGGWPSPLRWLLHEEDPELG